MIPLEFFIVVAALVGAAIGSFGTWHCLRNRAKSVESETWKSARIYFRNADKS